MAYCRACGIQLVSGAKFCQKCGCPTRDETTKKDRTEQKPTEKIVEKIHKCPHCGETIDSFVSICPTCGHELKNGRVSAALQDFVNRVNDCENDISNSPQAGKSGWSSWGMKGRFWWVILNIVFTGIPLAIYIAIPLLTVKSTPRLTREERRLAAVIENFAFPNDRESILSALLFAKDKIDFISKESINSKSAYWIRLWSAKAEQLKQKADILFPDDAIVMDSLTEIAADEASVNKTLKTKAIVGLIIFVFALAAFFVRNYLVWLEF